MTETVYLVMQSEYDGTNVLGIVARPERGKELADDAERADVEAHNQGEPDLVSIMGGPTDYWEHKALQWRKVHDGVEAKGHWYAYDIIRYQVQP